MKQKQNLSILILLILSIYFASYGMKLAPPADLTGLLHSTLSSLGYDDSGHTGFAKDVGSLTIDFHTKNLEASGSAWFDGDVHVGGSVLASLGSLIGNHDGLANLEYSVSGHSGFASSGAIPGNGSFTLTGLSEKNFSSLTGTPTNSSYTLNGLSEKDFDNLTNKPTSASYTLTGLSEKNFSSLTGTPTNSSYTLNGLSEKDFGSLTNPPTSASYTHSGLLGLSSDDHTQYLNLDGRTGAGQTVSGSVIITGTGSMGLFAVDGASASFNNIPFATAETNHANLTNLDMPSSGHTGFASEAAIPGNGSFTLNDLFEKAYSSLTGKPTSASWTLNGLSEKDFGSLTNPPTSASYAYNIASLTDAPSMVSAEGKVLGRNAANTAWEMTSGNSATSAIIVQYSGTSVAATSSLVLSVADSYPVQVLINNSMFFNVNLQAKYDGGYGGANLWGTLKNNSGSVDFVGSVPSFIWGDSNSFSVVASYSSDGILKIIASGPANLTVTGFAITTKSTATFVAASTILDATPCGGTILWATSTIPTGYLLQDGSTYSSATYPDLFAVIGTTTLRNFQGVFPKGMGTQTIGGVVHDGATLAAQSDVTQSHVHGFGLPGGAIVSVDSGGTTNVAPGGGAGSYLYYSGRTVDAPSAHSPYGTPRVGSFTEPANVGVFFIIKATRSVGSTGIDVVCNNLTVLGSMNTNNNPVGTVIMYDGMATGTNGLEEVIPGWLLENGAVASITTYASLSAKMGTRFNTGGELAGQFRLPDRRGVFSKGMGQNGLLGANYDNASGTPTADKFQSHRHVLPVMETGGGERILIGAAFDGTGTGNPGAYIAHANSIGTATVDGSNGSPRVGAVTEPANVGTWYLVKY